jgi:hypothetical protein
MIDVKLIELIQRDVDGDTTPEEKQHLNAVFAGNEEARKLHTDLRGLTLQLFRAGMVEAPRSLKPAIMRRVESMNVPAQQNAGRTKFSLFHSPSLLEVVMKGDQRRRRCDRLPHPLLSTPAGRPGPGDDRKRKEVSFRTDQRQGRRAGWRPGGSRIGCGRHRRKHV